MIKIYVKELLILGVLVDLYFTARPHPIRRVKLKGVPRRLPILAPEYGLDETFRMITPLDAATDSRYDCDVLYENKTSHLSGTKTCSLQEPGGGDSVDSCPYHYQLSYDQYRIPEAIVQVRCNCDACLTRNSSGQLLKLHDGTCSEVLVPRQVLRQCKKRGKRHRKVYTVRYEYYPVACTCKLAKPYTP